MTGKTGVPSDSMAGRTNPPLERRQSNLDSSSLSSETEGSTALTKRRALTVSTVKRWIAENDRALNTTTWLTYTASDRNFVESLKCSVCIKFQDKLRCMRNFKPGFIDGSRNLRVSSFKDHAASDMHARGMLLLRKESSSSVSDYAPIAKAFHRLDSGTEALLSKKFEIAYFIAKQNLSFLKMGPLCELLERLSGSSIGLTYRNDKACSSFVHYIAKDLQLQLLDTLSKVSFFSIQSDGSTDLRNIEEELFLIQYLNSGPANKQIIVENVFLAVRQPKSSTGLGLFQCFENTMAYIGISDWKERLVGYGCDGTSANMAPGGLRGHLERVVPWIVMLWCIAHRLELSISDSLKHTYFNNIDEMLLRLYYLYEKSPKKCRELEDIVMMLKVCLTTDEFSHKRGVRPIRASGTRFVTHKVTALNRVLERYGAYIAHLCSLAEDRNVKPVDRQKLKGYILHWREAKVLVGCAFFCDLLKPASVLSKALQRDDLCVLGAVETILKIKKRIENIKTTPFDDLPTIKLLHSRVKVDSSGTTYQGADICNYDTAMQYFRSNYSDLAEKVLQCLHSRIKDQHTELLTHLLTLLTPIGWDKSPDGAFGYPALNYFTHRFQDPLLKRNVVVTQIKEEWDDMIDYAKRYFDLVRDDYRVIWWKLFNCAVSSDWTNVLALISLLFCLPVSNGKLERIFSLMKNIKSMRRTSLGEDTLDDLLRIAQGPDVSEWNPKSALKLWWDDKTRRPVRAATMSTSTMPTTSAEDSTSDHEKERSPIDFQDWDEWMNSDIDCAND